MATLNEILAAETGLDNIWFEVDLLSRQIVIPKAITNLGVKGDKDVMKVRFKLPRFFYDVDFSEFKIGIDYMNAEGEEDRYEPKDVTITDNVVTFTWVVGRHAALYEGTVKFGLCAKRLNPVDPDDPNNEFHTTKTSLPILDGMETCEQAIVMHTDLLEQWREQLFGEKDSLIAAITEAAQAEQNAIANKGSEVLATIPAEYTETAEAAQEGIRTKADAIICKPRAEVISVSDSSDDYLRGLKIFGKTIQATEPSLDSPQELASVENPTVNLYGSNLLTDYAGYKATLRGITCEFEGNGVYHIYGTFSGTVQSLQFADIALNIPIDRNAKYTMSCELIEGTPPDDFHPYLGLSSSTVSHRNWLALNVDGKCKVGDIINSTLTPTDTLNDATHINRFWIYGYNDTLEAYTADFRIRVWLTKSDTPMSYEPYTKQKITITNTIRGIPVTTGGNYTDTNGQQWICDEVDFERAVYIQRVYALVSDYNGGWKISGNSTTNHNAFYRMNTELPTMIKGTNKPVVCTHFTMTRDPVADHVTCVSGGLSNQEVYFFVPKSEFPDVETWTNYVVEQANAGTPITTYYILNTPIETPLSAEELAAFKALHTNYPNTTVLNDAGATMELTYNADTKTWVENRTVGIMPEFVLKDKITGKNYTIYVSDGILHMESEV